MTRFPSPLTTATLLLLLLSVAAMAADTGPLSVDTEGGNDVLAPLAAVPIEPEPANSSVVASRSLAAPTLVPCTDTKKPFKVEGQSGKKKCAGWKKVKGVCDKSDTVSSMCAKSCATNTDTGRIKVQGQNGQKKCKDWEKKGLCTSAMKKYGGAPLFTVCEKSCNHCPAAPTGPTLVPCTDTKKKKIKVEGQSGNKKCAWWKKKVKGVCDNLIKGKSDTVSSVCAKSCATNTVNGRIKVQGQNGQKKCKDWEKKGQCTSAMKKYGGAPLFTVCEKSCNHCGGPPTEAPTTTFAPSATFAPTETWPPSATFKPTETFKPSNTKNPAYNSAPPSDD